MKTKKRNRLQKAIADISLKVNVNEGEIESVYGISKRQLRTMRMRGDGPPWVKISGQIGHSGGRVLYPVESLKRWLATRPGGGCASVTAA